VYGLLDVGYTAVENASTTTAGATTTAKINNTGNGDGALATSRLGFRGTEDLGGGLKANFQLEYDLVDVGTGGNSFGARYSWVGLQDAKLGQLRLGQQEQTIHSVAAAGLAGAANNIAGSIYSAGASNISTNSASIRPYDVFVNRAVTYISPRISGFTFELQTADLTTKPGVTGTDETSSKTFGGSLKYSAGALNLAYGFAELKTDASSANNTADKRDSQVISANYDLKTVKLFAVHSMDKVTTAGALTRDTKATEVGVQVPMGKTTLWASAFDGDRKGNGSAADVAGLASRNADVSGFQIGARHDLSKRTAIYAILGEQEIKGVAGNAAKIKSEGMAVGVRHSF
jgi:predicted porin